MKICTSSTEKFFPIVESTLTSFSTLYGQFYPYNALLDVKNTYYFYYFVDEEEKGEGEGLPRTRVKICFTLKIN